jgi:hypothetical protein
MNYFNLNSTKKNWNTMPSDQKGIFIKFRETERNKTTSILILSSPLIHPKCESEF